MREITLRKPDDFHIHLRQGELMPHLVREAGKVFQRVLVMPNTLPPIANPKELQDYESQLRAVDPGLELLMTFKLMPDMKPEIIGPLKRAGAIAGKLYPQGVSTNSEDGVTEIESLYPVFQAMQEEDLALCIHAEMPGVGEMEAEQAFFPVFQKIHSNFPRLRMVLEHVSSKAGVEFVKSFSSHVGATVTIHHLLLTDADVHTSHGLNPHHYCRPVCKTEADRKALQEIILSGHPQFFFGSDSAPHLKETKEVEGKEPSRGVFSTPVAIPLLTQFFEDQGRLEMLEPFISVFGADFYQLPSIESFITLQKSPWKVPEEMFGVVPLWASKTLDWKITQF